MRGRPRSSTRAWVEECSVIDSAEITKRARRGFFINRPESVTLTWQDHSRRQLNVRVTTTRPNYGGTRYWYVCPLPRCGRRSAKLYVTESGICGCRRCLGLVYECQYRKSSKYWLCAIVREYLRSLSGPSRFEKLLAQHGPGIFT